MICKRCGKRIGESTVLHCRCWCVPMTLADKARAAAEAAVDDWFSKDHPMTEDVAEAIERVALEYAYDALKQFCAFDDIDTGKGMTACIEAMRAALKAAAGGDK